MATQKSQSAKQPPLWRGLVVGGFMAMIPVSAWADSEREARLEAQLKQLELAVQGLRAELDAVKAEKRANAANEAAAPAHIANQAHVDHPPGEAVAAPIIKTTDAHPKPETAPPIENASHADGFKVGNTSLSFSGYIKVDAFGSIYSSGDPAADAIISDYYAPAQIPIGGVGEGLQVTSSVRETRFIFKSETPAGKKTLQSHLELDFLDTPLIGNQRVSNSFVPRVRRAFITYGNLTIGQDWTTFQNVAALPERVDFIGPTDGTVFERQPLIRYKIGKFSLALENPETTATLGTQTISADDDLVPDFIARFDQKLKNASFSLAGIGRVLRFNNNGPNPGLGRPGAIDDIGFGWGVNGTGIYERGPHRFSFSGTVGQGIGRYVGLNIRDDVVIGPSGLLTAPLLYAGFASYRYAFNPHWKAIATLSGYHSNTPDFASTTLTSDVYSASLDVLYSPVKLFTLGVGLRQAERGQENGLSGKLRRVQFSAKYDF